MKLIKAEILTIGDELLYGQVLDTNAHWLSEALDQVGIKIIRRTTIGDSKEEILNAFREAETRADIILITGGLGPTSDDLTKPCLTQYFNTTLEINEEALTEVSEFFKQRGRALTEVNRQQAALPKGCVKITNKIGTAPGMWLERNGKVFVSMPGVPHEMKLMVTNIIIPKLKNQFTLPIIYHQIIRTIGIGESFLSEKITTWEKELPTHIKLAYLPSIGEVRLRLTAFGDNVYQLQSEVDQLVKNLTPLIGEYIYSLRNETLETAVGNLLREKKLTLSIAESCTGGFLTHLITSVPGSSDYFLGSIVPYAYEIKMRQLGVKPETLEKYGAVSEPTIIEMANLVRAKFNTDIGVATSGIAGPGGATPEKPVGTIWIAYSDKFHTVTKKLQLTNDRLLNIKFTSVLAMNLIRQSLPKSG